MNNLKSHKNVGMLLAGFILIIVGLIIVTMNTTVHFELYRYSVGRASLSSGLLLIPLFISIVLITALKNKWPGRILMWLSTLAILISLVLSIRIHLNTMDLFSLIIMFMPILVGLGLIFRCTLTIKWDEKTK